MKNQLDINFVRSQFPAFQNEKTQKLAFFEKHSKSKSVLTDSANEFF